MNRPAIAETPSANTMGIENRIRTMKMAATRSRSISVGAVALWRRWIDDHRQRIDHQQRAADRARGVEHRQWDRQAGRDQRVVEDAELDAEPARDRAHHRDQRVVDAV